SIEEEEVKKKLKEKAKFLKDVKEVTFFTDGSWINPEGDQEKAKMGEGWIAIGNNLKKEETKADFFCGFTNWPSATRAELGAIGTALLAAPENAKVTVVTDNAAAI